MLSDKEEEKLINDLIKLCRINGVDEKVIDFEHEIDSKLSYSENYDILKEAYNLKDKNDMKNYANSINDKYTYEKWNEVKNDGLTLFENYKPFCVAIIGSRDSGKTAQAHQVCDRIRKTHHLPIYAFRYPMPYLLNNIGYKNLKELRSLERMNNCILWMDEPQITLPKYDGRGNDKLEELLSICRHRRIVLVVSTADTRWINRALESWVDVWIVKDIDFEMIKQGSRAKYVIKQNAILDPSAFKLDKNEYLMYYRQDEQYQGKFDISLPLYWNESYSKPYQITTKTTKEIAK